MSIYAFVTNENQTTDEGEPIVVPIIQRTGQLPRSARRLDTNQWVMGLATAPVDAQQACGWYEIVTTDKPDDTDTTTHDRSIELVNGVPTIVWTERDKTADELNPAPTREEVEDTFADAIANAQTMEEMRQAAVARAAALETVV